MSFTPKLGRDPRGRRLAVTHEGLLRTTDAGPPAPAIRRRTMLVTMSASRNSAPPTRLRPHQTDARLASPRVSGEPEINVSVSGRMQPVEIVCDEGASEAEVEALNRVLQNYGLPAASPSYGVRVRPHVSVGVRPDVQVGLRRVELLLARVGATLRGSPWAHSPEPPYVVLAGPDRPSDAAGYPKHLVTVSKVDHRAGSRAEPCLCL